jgi:Uma2 family endonuclease
MAHGAPARTRYTKEQYFRLVTTGVLRPEDRVELLEGVVVAMAPQSPRHATAVRQISEALGKAVAGQAIVSTQLPLIAGKRSVPQPDVAVLPGSHADYLAEHPHEALLVVEVAESSLAQDRITKTAMYARAGVPEYWIVNLRDDCVEVRREPEPDARRYGSVRIARRGERIELVGLPGVSVAVDDLLPSPAR